MIKFEEKLKCGAATLRVHEFDAGQCVQIDLVFDNARSYSESTFVADKAEQPVIQLFASRTNFAQIRKALDTVDPPVVTWFHKIDAKLKSWRIL